MTTARVLLVVISNDTSRKTKRGEGVWELRRVGSGRMRGAGLATIFNFTPILHFEFFLDVVSSFTMTMTIKKTENMKIEDILVKAKRIIIARA